MSAIPLSQLASSGCWQTNMLAILPAVEKHAAISFRHLNPADKEEAVAETIAAAFVNYGRLTQKKKLSHAYAGSVAEYAVKIVRGHRHVGGHMSSRDVMSPLAQKHRGFAVGSLAWGPPEGPWQEVVVDSRRTSPADRSAFLLDFAQWLAQWSGRDRRIINALAAGNHTLEAAQRFKVSEARISQLRREYQRSWEQFQGMAPGAVVA